jgi:hypothetical protein
MKPCDPSRIRRQDRRAEAWRSRALAMEMEAQAANEAADSADRAAAAFGGPCPRCEDLERELRDAEREIQHAARDSFGEGYQRGREDADGGGW